MSIRNNPGTVSSNLRFAYDIADTRNSYAGEPTTNLIAYSQPTNGAWNTNGAGSIITQNFGYSPIGTLNSSLVQDNQSSGNAPFCYYAASVSSNTIYTISVWVKPSKANTTWGLYVYEMSPNISLLLPHLARWKYVGLYLDIATYCQCNVCYKIFIKYFINCFVKKEGCF